ncbi:CALCIUM-DEPENDENT PHOSPHOTRIESTERASE SUPERFAMILY PROTEIN-RELATED [Salix koriyanagi]|uniref:CALCIUM-DEPENDENT PHOSPHOTRIESTERASE SUPERFAMILY PROTEIN-RELATED n=1 Tax=Salix koriyanagi TaxID=2511006 RepID=A0A9Q0U4P8_9ROSI|nr:CALCIUM-DEPENDENT PHOSPHOTRIESTERASE SUPERFAMILY PROTEIN-RELATED [Salix koriyanagi]
MAFSLCSTKTLLLFFLISAIPVAFIISSELAKPPTHVASARSPSPKITDRHRKRLFLKEVTVVKDPALAGNSSLGIVVDRPRNRLLVAISDLLGNKYNALAAYDLSTWDRLFLTKLGGPDNEKAFADDVAVDAEGNAYVTDAKSNKIWKVGADGKFVSFIRNPLFIAKEWYKNLIGLNGIVYHPDGFLIVIHTFSGMLYKIDVTKEDHEVKLIKVAGGSLAFGDGLELLSPTKLVVAGNPSGRLVESLDGWETASVVAKFKGPAHRLATAATVKDGRVYLNHLLGMGYPKKQHALVEAVFYFLRGEGNLNCWF